MWRAAAAGLGRVRCGRAAMARRSGNAVILREMAGSQAHATSLNPRLPIRSLPCGCRDRWQPLSCGRGGGWCSARPPPFSRQLDGALRGGFGRRCGGAADGACRCRTEVHAGWREDRRRDPNGMQVRRVVGLTLRAPPSVDFCGYWQRARPR
jgi:hypothetical protein